MKIAVIGAAGKAGTLISREARLRGHDVTAIVRTSSKDKLEFPYSIIEKDLFTLTPDDLKDFEAVINAFGTPFDRPGEEHLHFTAAQHMVKVFENLPNVRLITVGGAASLYKDKSKTSLVLEDIPAEYKAVPENAAKGFDIIKQSNINWTYVSPPVNFDSGGVRTGKYISGTDFVIPNASGESYGSYADFAVAVVDELEQKRNIRKRFTIVSDSPFYHGKKQLFNMAVYPFYRRYGYLGVYCQGDGSYGNTALNLGSRHGSTALVNTGPRLIDFWPTYNGEKVPCSVRTSACELTVMTRYGNLYMCFAEPGMLIIKGDKGMGLRFYKEMRSDVIKPKANGSYEVMFRRICSVLLMPKKGKINVDAPWNAERLTHPVALIDVLPEDNGSFELVIDEFVNIAYVKEKYPSYDEGLKSSQEDWKSFLDTIPNFSRELEDKKEEYAYVLWSHLAGPCGKIKRPMMFMFANSVGSSWQMCMNAVALGQKDLALPIELLLNNLDEMTPIGQVMDFYDDMWGSMQVVKPLLWGWAIKLLMKKHDLSKAVPKDKLQAMYSGFALNVSWYENYRDDDNDGLFQYEHGYESGSDDSTVFNENMILESPDLSAFMALSYEALGDIALMLGKPQTEADAWYNKSKETIKKMIDAFWTGERFVALTNFDHKKIETGSYVFYLPIILGKRLPQNIIDKMAEDLSIEGELLTPYGLATEKLSSPDFRLGAMVLAKGSIMPQTNIKIALGLLDAGKPELAKLIANRYCKTVKDMGPSFLMNPFRGSGAYFGSWTCCAYFTLAAMLNDL